MASVGRCTLVLKKKEKVVWQNLIPDSEARPQNMHIWWEIKVRIFPATLRRLCQPTINGPIAILLLTSLRLPIGEVSERVEGLGQE